MILGCSERIELSVDNSDKLLLECILEPGHEITAKLSTVAHFSQIDNVIYPEDARVYLTTNLDVPLEFQFDADRQLYYIPKSFHTPNPANPYEITAHLKESTENEVNAKTKFIPTTQFIKQNKTEVSINDKGRYTLKTFLKSSNRLESKQSYFRVNAFYKPIINGELGELTALDFIENSIDPLAFFQNEYTDGIYVNLSRVDFTSFDMAFQLPSGLSLEDVDENIYLHVSALNEDVYRYEISKSKRLASLKSGSSDPVMSYTNIDNGHGVFGTRNTSLSVIPIK